MGRAFRLLLDETEGVRVALEDPEWQAPQAVIGVEDLVDALVDRGLAYSSGRPVEGRLEVAVMPHNCWRRDRAYALLSAWEASLCRCGRELRGPDGHLAQMLREHRQQLLEVAARDGLALAELHERFSKTVDARYWANCCPHEGCSGWCGGHFLFDEMAGHMAGGDGPDVVVALDPGRLAAPEDPHWCLGPPA